MHTKQDVRGAALEFLFNLAVSNGPLTQQTLRWLVTSLTPSPADVAYLDSRTAQHRHAVGSQAQQQHQQHQQQHQPSAAGAMKAEHGANGQSGSELSADAVVVLPGAL